jgi:hypothetical protein
MDKNKIRERPIEMLPTLGYVAENVNCGLKIYRETNPEEVLFEVTELGLEEFASICGDGAVNEIISLVTINYEKV